MRDTITAIQHDTSGPAAGIQRKDGLKHRNDQNSVRKCQTLSSTVDNSITISLSYLDRHVHGRDVESLKHDLRGQEISPAVQCRMMSS